VSLEREVLEKLEAWAGRRRMETEAAIEAVRHALLHGGDAEFSRLYRRVDELEQECQKRMDELRVLGVKYRETVRDPS
jgi:hypothetical protein